MRKYVISIICIAVAAGLIGSALYMRNQSNKTELSNADKITPPPATSPSKVNQQFSAAELAKFNGKDGAKCYVAVDSKVYHIEQGLLWRDGQHETSEGQAMCGVDLSEVIGKSPHGKAKLTTLESVGTFTE